MFRPLLVAAIVLVWSGTGHAQVMVPDEEEETKPHHLSLFVGVRYADSNEKEDGPQPEFLREDERLTDLTVGLNFEYLGRDNVGVTLFGSRTGGDTDSWLLGAGMNVHGGRSFYFQFATVYEWLPDESQGSLRAGLGWELKTGKKRRTTITPTFSIDLSTDEIVLWGGLAIGRRF